MTHVVLDWVQVDRFKREKLSDFKRIILDYIQLQIEYSKKVRGFRPLGPMRERELL